MPFHTTGLPVPKTNSMGHFLSILGKHNAGKCHHTEFCLSEVPFWCCGIFGKCFLGGAPLYLQILKLYVGGQIHKPMLTTGINNQMLHNKGQENHLVCPKRLIYYL